MEGAYWSVVSDSTAENQIVCPPSPAGTGTRYEVLSKPAASFMKDVTLRFRAPDEDLYVQLSVKCAGSDVAALLGCTNSKTLLDVQIGELAPSGTFMPRVMKGTWRFARLPVTDLNPLFNPFKWMPPPLAVDAAAAPEVDEEDYIAGKYWAGIEPSFGMYTMRGKKPKLLCGFHITAITKKAVRKASGAGETDSTTFWLECKEQDGTVTEVPVNFDSLRGFSTASAFDRVNARLLCTQTMKEGTLRDIIYHLDAAAAVPIVTAPSVFGLQPCGDFLFSNCVLPADGTPAVSLDDRDLFIDKEFLARRYQLYEEGYPSMLLVPSPVARYAVFRYMTDAWGDVFKNNEHQAWTTLSYGVCGFDYQYWQGLYQSYPTLFATGPKACGKTTSADIVKSLTGAMGGSFRSDITAPKLAQVASASPICPSWWTTSPSQPRPFSPQLRVQPSKRIGLRRRPRAATRAACLPVRQAGGGKRCRGIEERRCRCSRGGFACRPRSRRAPD